MTLPISLQRAFLRQRFHSIRTLLKGRKFSLKKVALKQRVVELKQHSRSEQVKNEQENILAHTSVPIDTQSNTTQKSPRKKKATFWFFLLLVLASCIALVVLLLPAAYYTAFPTDPIPISSEDLGTPLGGSFQRSKVLKQVPEPPVNENLPSGTWLSIPRIGVQTEILESANPDEALAKGVWRVTDFGQPGDQSKPMILAAHRFGYKWWWTSSYWKYHSFYLLPKLVPGDLVEVIANKKKYVYEIYAGEEGESITDYNADLILYTCKFLNSPLRHFRYARLIDPTANTQKH